MISKTKQNWNIGGTVKVGFMTLTVVRACYTPGDFAPDAYVLTNVKQDQLYKFVPHFGLEKISITQANELIAESVRFEKAEADKAIANAMRTSIVSQLIAA